jgi:hypothetical protein
MRKWEYRVVSVLTASGGIKNPRLGVYVDYVKSDLAPDTPALVLLNMLGEEGWKLVSTKVSTTEHSSSQYFYLKRPKTE